MSRLPRLALVPLCCVVTACGMRTRAVVAVPAAAPAAARADVAALEALYRARTDSARRRFTPADVAFVNGMIHHHAQALVMAAWAPRNGAGDAVRVLAARIANAQRDEIALMRQWLADRGQPVPALHGAPPDLVVHDPTGHAHAMPGMLSAGQLAALRDARGVAFDRLFLRLMIQHHQGAVAMVDALFATDGAGNDEAVFALASDVHADQTTEIARMEQLLAALRGPDQDP